MNIIGSYLSIQDTAYLCLPLPLLFLMLMLSLPESPYYYIMKNEEEDAKNSLRFFRGNEDVEEEYIELKAAVERQISERGTWIDLLKIRSNRRAVISGVFLRISQQMSGTMVFTNLSQFIFKKAGTDISAELSSMIFSGLLFLATLCNSYTVERFGRKKNYLYSLFACSMILLLLAVFFFLDQNMNMNLESIQWFPLGGMLLYIISISFGVVMVPSLMLSELFSASIKAKALTLTTILIGLTQFVTNHLFYILYAQFGLYAPFLLFSVGSFVSALLTLKLVPETKGKTLEEIQQALRQ